MTCARCLDRFHVLKCGKQDDQCTQTYLNNWANVQAKYPSFTYTCDSCREDIALKNEDILVNRLALMEENIAFLVQEIRSMKENVAAPVAPVSYAAAAGKPAVVEKPAVIVIANKPEENAVSYKQNQETQRRSSPVLSFSG